MGCSFLLTSPVRKQALLTGLGLWLGTLSLQPRLMWMFSSFTLLSWDHSACSGGLTCLCPPSALLIPCLDSWLPIVLGKASPPHMVNLLIPAWASIPHQGRPCSWPCSSPSWALTHVPPWDTHFIPSVFQHLQAWLPCV